MIEHCHRKVLELILPEARERFARLEAERVVHGEYDGVWRYRGGNLNFRRFAEGVRNRCKFRSDDEMSADGDRVARIYALSGVESGLSFPTVQQRLLMVRRLDGVVTKLRISWGDISSAVLNRTMQGLAGKQTKKSIHHYGHALGHFSSFLNKLVVVSEGTTVRFNRIHLVWSPGRRTADCSPGETAADTSPPASNFYEPNLHRAIATARQAVLRDPGVEPKVGYDRIRLESLAFGLALGIRISALCQLPVNALERHSTTGGSFVRVPALKGEAPRVMPVPSAWEDAIWGAYSYLVETCADARARAAEIEKTGFKFLVDRLEENRRLRPLDAAAMAQLNARGLDQECHYFASELEACWDISHREVIANYPSSAVPIPERAHAVLAQWMDDRVRNWDWHMFHWPAKTGGPCITRIAELSGAMRGSPGRTPYAQLLKKFLAELVAAGVGRQGAVSRCQRESLTTSWENIRPVVLSNWQRATSIAVDVTALAKLMMEDYESALERHFKEALEDNDVGDQGSRRPAQQKPGARARLSEHLIVVWDNQMRSSGKNGLLPRPLSRDQIHAYLSASSGKATVFDRLDLRDENGRHFSFSPHAIRRWVTTSMLRSGLSEDSVDLWMGRQVGRARHYDYRTPVERAEKLRQLYVEVAEPPDDFLGRRVAEWRVRGMSDAEIKALVDSKLRAVHFTPWGSCSRELYVAPCEKGLMCLRGGADGRLCSSFQVDTNDLSAKAEIERLRSENSRLLEIIEPRSMALREKMISELNCDEPLDQHVRYIVDVISGCDEALRIYRESASRLAILDSTESERNSNEE